MPEVVQSLPELTAEIDRLRAAMERARDALWDQDPWSLVANLLHYELTGQTVSERFPPDSTDQPDHPWQLADPQMWAAWFAAERGHLLQEATTR